MHNELVIARPATSPRRLHLPIACLLGALLASDARAEPAPRPDDRDTLPLASALVGHTLVDLTHVLDADFPYIPAEGTYPFSLRSIATLEEHGVAANEWHIHEHLGTQIDAPCHFAAAGRCLHELRTSELIVPLVVVDVRARAEEDPDLEITKADLQRWERVHGRIPRGALVAMYSGWEERIGDSARYLGLDAAGVKHFPGFSVEAALFLARERDVWGVGVDTISFDPGHDGTYQTHRALLAEDRWAVEALARLDQVPARGALAVVGATKVRDATGGPVRVLALYPRGLATVADTRPRAHLRE